jgi:hypothetical protein
MDGEKLVLNVAFYIRQAFLRRADEQNFPNRPCLRGFLPISGIALSYLLK